MKFYFAPMESITIYLHRNAYQTFFHDVDKYFTPFISPNQKGVLSPKVLKDLLPDNNRGLTVIPQILTNNSEAFIQTAEELEKLGYGEINLNLGCPSGTVVSKNKGSGFLSQPEQLNRFLDEIYSGLSMKISIKTRLGKSDPEEFYDLIEIFNQYPIEELIIHPRIQKDYYKNHVRLEIFKDAMSLSKNPVCYNGDIFTSADYREFTGKFPDVDSVMLGRGLIANPGLIGEIKRSVYMDKKLFKEFYDTIYSGYRETLSGDRNILFKMKELWMYMIALFPDSDRYLKRIKKAERLYEFDAVIAALLSERDIEKGAGFCPKL